MFVAVLFVMAKNWKCSTVSDKIKTVVYPYNEVLYNSKNKWTIYRYNNVHGWTS